MREAKDEVGKWLGQLNLGRDLSGRTIGLREHANLLKFEGSFRAMVIDAATRKLKHRGAVNVILPK